MTAILPYAAQEPPDGAQTAIANGHRQPTEMAITEAALSALPAVTKSIKSTAASFIFGHRDQLGEVEARFRLKTSNYRRSNEGQSR